MSEAPNGAPEGVTEDTQVADLIEANPVANGPGDDAAATTDDQGQADQPKPKKTAQERINELTAARREAERDRDFYREQALRGQQAQPAPVAQEQTQGDGRPDRADYDDDFQFIDDLTDWKAEKAVERLSARHAQNERVTSVRTNFETRTKTLFPTGETAGLEAFRRIPELPIAVLEIVGESEIGPKIAEHLGANPAELARLQGLSPIQQARELTRLETRLEGPPKLTPKTATDAPEPIPAVRGSGGRFQVAPDTDDFAAFYKQYGLGGS
jgi:hypothetical protein